MNRSFIGSLTRVLLGVACLVAFSAATVGTVGCSQSKRCPHMTKGCKSKCKSACACKDCKCCGNCCKASCAKKCKGGCDKKDCHKKGGDKKGGCKKASKCGKDCTKPCCKKGGCKKASKCPPGCTKPCCKKA